MEERSSASIVKCVADLSGPHAKRAKRRLVLRQCPMRSSLRSELPAQDRDKQEERWSELGRGQR